MVEGAEHERSGPSTGVVIAGTLLAAALVAGGILGVLAWQGDDDDDERATGPATTAPATTERAVEEPSGSFIVRRTTEAGIELRIQRSEWADMPGFVPADAATTTRPVSTEPPPPTTVPEDPRDADGNGRPDICEPFGDAIGWAIDESSVLQGSTPVVNGRLDGIYPSAFFSMAEATIAAFIVQVDADVTSLRLLGPDGSADEMEPVDRLAIVALPRATDGGAEPMGPAGPEWVDDYTLIASRADGTRQQVTGAAMTRGHPAWNDPDCVEGGDDVVFGEPAAPEPELPAPGEPPPDEDAAREEIEANFESLFGDETDRSEKLALIDDSYGLDDVLDDIGGGEFSGEAAAASANVTTVVFVSPLEAVFTYRLITPGIDWPEQVGRARLLDGVWKVTRSTWCQDLQKAGVSCPL